MRADLPELLAPAGGFDALEAAIEAGADAVYFGGESFGARAFAKNFSRDEIAAATKLCRAYGVKSYVTLNTLVFDREMRDMLAYAAFLEEAGADALIIADMGAAALIREKIPTMPLHASTQFSGHGADAARFLAAHGFERMVAARELSRENLTALCKASPIEIEVFIHGALCVCHSGQCLFSSMVGGRSGNRGMCAQPCRLPDKSGNYPLSLKDLSMAGRIPELLSTGAKSLKIEGRMKAPEYVFGVTKIYRRLLDERRRATPEEERELAEIFSRSGFTTGYFDGKISSSMLGVRRADDKESSRAQDPFTGLQKKLPLTLAATLRRGEPFTLTVAGARGSVTVTGGIPEAARTAPLDAAALEKNLAKLGGTPYFAEKTDIALDGGLILRVSEINALRREALAAYAALGERKHVADAAYTPERRAKEDPSARTALVMRAKNLPADDAFYAFFDLVFLPLSEYRGDDFPRVRGVALPGVIPDGEREKVLADLSDAVDRGARHALCGNYGHLALCREAGLVPHGDFRLNVTNSEAAAFALANGFADLILSPELSAAQLRDIGGRVRAVVYGRVPLMLLEKCAAAETSGCTKCADDRAALTDRMGKRFPILREEPHRNILVNCVPTYAAEHPPLGGQHFIFTVERPAEILRVLDAYRRGLPPVGEIRRLK